MQIAVAANLQAIQKQNIEGLTKAQARKVADNYRQHIAWATEALTRGDDDAAFEFDCDAMDLEAMLVHSGFGSLISI